MAKKRTEDKKPKAPLKKETEELTPVAFVTEIAGALVDNKDAFKVTKVGEGVILIEAAPGNDTGQIIGKKGCNIKAIGDLTISVARRLKNRKLEKVQVLT